MGEWIICTIDDIGTVVGGGTPSTKKEEYYGDEIGWITPKDLAGCTERYIEKGERSITKLGYENSSAKLLPVNSVLFTSRAPIGYIAIAKNPVCTNQGFKSIVPNEKVDSIFLYYLLKYNKDKIASMGSGTTFKEVSGSVMKKIEVRIPKSLDEQRRIANILDLIDRKIETNNKLNANLEEVVSTKFQEIYSVDTDLRGNMSEIVVFSNGKKKPDGSGEVPIYGGNGILAYTNDSNYEDIIIVGRVGAYCGSLYYEPGLCWVSDNAIAAKSRTNCNYYIYELLKIYNLNNMHIGSSQPLLTQGILNSIEIKLLDEEIISSFNNWAKSFYALVSLKKKENQKLEHLRDVLLPRLMSGEIDLFEID